MSPAEMSRTVSARIPLVCLGEVLTVVDHDLRIEPGALFRRTPLGGEIDVDDAEALGIAQRPFEIVEQRPDHIALDVYASGYGVVDRRQVPAQIVDAQRILDERVLGGRRIEKSGAVFGYNQGYVAVALLYPHQSVGQARRVHLPVGLGIDC